MVIISNKLLSQYVYKVITACFKSMLYTVSKTRSSSPEVFCKKGVLRPATLLKKDWHRCFFVNFAEFLGTAFFHRAPPVAVSEKRLWFLK